MCSTQIEKEPLANLPLSNIRSARKSTSGLPSNPLLSIKFNGPVLPPPFGFPQTTDVPLKLEKGACNLQGGLEVKPISPVGTKDKASSPTTISTDTAPCPPGGLKVEAALLSTRLGEMKPMGGITDEASSPSMSLEELPSWVLDEESSALQTSLEGVEPTPIAPGEPDGKALPPCKSLAPISAANLEEDDKIPSTGMNEVTKTLPKVVIKVERAPFEVVHMVSSTKPDRPNTLRLIPPVNAGLHETAPASPDGSDEPAPLQSGKLSKATTTQTVEYVDAEVQTIAAWCYILGVPKISHEVDGPQQEDPVEVLTRSSTSNQLMSLICPTCRARRIASAEGKPGFEAMMSRRLLPVVGHICEGCIIPCFLRRCGNADYVCPNCQQYI